MLAVRGIGAELARSGRCRPEEVFGCAVRLAEGCRGTEGLVLAFGLVSGFAVRVGVAADESEVAGARFGEVGVGEG